jgi:hypothetical protein
MGSATYRIMESTSEALSPLDDFVGPMLGLPAWGVKQGYGSFLTFEFGQPKLVVVERKSGERHARRSVYIQGQWHLWIYCCHWRAFQDDAQLACSDDANEQIGRAAAILSGQKLTAIRVDPAQGRCTFELDLGGLLETWPYGDDSSDEQWTILTDTEAFGYRADGFYHRDPIDTKPNKERWLPLR